MSNRSKACSFSPKVKAEIYARHNGKCLWCGAPGIGNVHYISRAHGGLGIVENGLCGCEHCHHEYDNGMNRAWYQEKADDYMRTTYPNFTDEQRKYNKWRSGK